MHNETRTNTVKLDGRRTGEVDSKKCDRIARRAVTWSHLRDGGTGTDDGEIHAAVIGRPRAVLHADWTGDRTGGHDGFDLRAAKDSSSRSMLLKKRTVGQWYRDEATAKDGYGVARCAQLGAETADTLPGQPERAQEEEADHPRAR